jgi:hypothetical protein
MATGNANGLRELRYVADRLRKAAARDLTRELAKGQRAAFRPLQKEIAAEALATLPKRGGYNVTMAKAIKVTVTTGFGRNALQARVYAKGKDEARDVRRVNAGELRHPLFGRRSNWHTTRVRAGFVDRPVRALSDRVLKECADAAQRVNESIARG